MFKKKTKNGLDFDKPKFTTFGSDSDLEEEMETDEVPNVEDFMKGMDGEIKSAKQREANATIAKVYHTQQKRPAVKVVNACGCFGG